MIEITLTLFVQAIHFFIAYLILRYTFLQPALTLLVGQQNQRLLLKKAIQVARRRVEHQQKIKDSCYQACRETFASACHTIDEATQSNRAFAVQPIDPVPIVISPHEIEHKREQAKLLLVKQLETCE